MQFSSFLGLCKLLVFVFWMSVFDLGSFCVSGLLLCGGVWFVFSICVSGVGLCKLFSWLSTCSRLAFLVGFRSS